MANDPKIDKVVSDLIRKAQDDVVAEQLMKAGLPVTEENLRQFRLGMEQTRRTPR